MKGKLYEEYYYIRIETIDEAKREFPADAHGLKVDEVMPWFWKYFGDGESE